MKYFLALGGLVMRKTRYLLFWSILVMFCSHASGQTITTIAGAGRYANSGDGGPATVGEVYRPYGIATDRSGNTYIADQVTHRIRKVDASGIITTVAGNTYAGYGGDGGPATNASLYGPIGVCADNHGQIYIADEYNHRIRKVNSSGIISTVAGNGAYGYTGDGGPATAAELYYPTGVSADTNGNLFIADYYNHSIRKIDATGTITTVAGNGSHGFSGDGGPATAAQLYYPFNVITDYSDNLLIADQYNARIRMVDVSGNIATVAGSSSAGFGGDGGPATAASLYYPYSMVADPSGTIYISDYGNERIRKVKTNGIISTIAGIGSSGFSGDGGPATAGEFHTPIGIAIDTTGNLYVSDYGNNRIREIDVNGTLSTFAGNGFAGNSGDGGPATGAELNTPTGVTTDAGGNVYIADIYNGRIRKVNSSGIISTAVGDGQNVFGGDGGPASAASVYYPFGVATDVSGNLYIADYGNQRIRKVNTSNIISTIAGNGSIGYTGDGGPATAGTFDYPTGVAADTFGNIFVADIYNNCVRKITTGGIITTVAGNGSAGYGGDGGPATAASLNLPYGVAADVTGNLYISDFGNHRIRKVNLSGIISTVAGTGTGGYSGDGNPATASRLYYPIGISADTNGNIFIGDYANYRIRKINPAGIIFTVAGNGSAGFSGDGGPATAAVLNVPYGITNDAAGNILIADEGNNRVRRVDGTQIGKISGSSMLCVGATTTLSDTTNAGTWISNNTAVAAVGSVSGIISGVSPGTAMIIYSSGTDAALFTMTINPTPIITGGTAVCAGNTTTLSGNIAGGTWSCSNTTVASIGSTGIISGIGAGNPAISYLLPTGCMMSTTFAVNSLPSAISGPSALCVGSPTTLSNTVAGGSWSSSNTAVATIVTAGAATGISAGLVNISYTLGTGCSSLVALTVNPLPAAGSISGISTLNAGVTVTMSSTIGGGSWSSSNTNVVTINSGTGIARGLLTGTSVISYSVTNVCGTATATQSVLVTAGTASGTITTIAGNGTYGFNGDGGPAISARIAYPWKAKADAIGNLYIPDFGNSRVRKVSIYGVITTYAGNGARGSLGDGGQATAAQLVDPAGVAFDAAGNLYIADQYGNRIRKVSPTGTISTFAGTGTVGFNGDNISAISANLSNPTAVFADGAGNVFIADGSSCRVRKVDASSGFISTIAGTGTCGYNGDGGPATAARLGGPSDITFDGSGNLFIADYPNNRIRKVNSSGIISTVAGTNAYGYNGDGIPATAAQLHTPFGVSTDGAGNLYIGDFQNFRIRKVDVTTGIISTVAGNGSLGYSGDGGPATAGQLGYPVGASVDAIGNIFIGDYNNNRIRIVRYGNHLPRFTNGNIQNISVCNDTNAISLDTALAVTDSDTWQPETWTTVSAPIYGTLATNVIATSFGSTTIATGLSYTPPIGYSGPDTFKVRVDDGIVSDTVTVYLTVNLAPGAMLGSPNICMGSPSTLSWAVTGGTWTSSNGSSATVTGVGGGTCVVSPVSPGTAIVTYQISAGCTSVTTVTVNSSANAGTISGAASVATGYSILFTHTLPGGSWTSSNTTTASVLTSSGVVTGIAPGTANITYTVINGCGSAYAVRSITVTYALPPISGISNVCPGLSTTLYNTTTGGTWSSNNTNIAIGSASGIVSALVAGTSIVTYSAFSTFVTTLVRIGAPVAISGATSVCMGQSTTVFNSVAGGTWSTPIPYASIGSASGIVSGNVAGTTRITYTLGTGCFTVQTITVHPFSAITGPSSVCGGQSVTLANATIGGTWSSSNINALVGSTGVVTGLGAVVAAISYIVPTGCTGVKNVTVNPMAPIIGPPTICSGNSVTLSDPITGGTWSSSGIFAVVGSTSGRVIGSVPGGVTISYQLGNCMATQAMTVYPFAPNTGPASVCNGQIITIANATPGGIWSTSNSNTSVGSTTGIVTGRAYGTADVSYLLPSGCLAVKTVSVNPLAPISGPQVVCAGLAVTLSDLAVGGTWTRTSIHVGIGSIPGLILGSIPGITSIVYTLGSCSTAYTMTVNPFSFITGPASACNGQTITLANATPGGRWSTSNTNISLGSASGIMSAISAGIANISYTLPNSCMDIKTVTVNPIAPIYGPSTVCASQSVTLSNAFPGGTWSRTSIHIGIGSASGEVFGSIGGITNILYTLGSCTANFVMTVNPFSVITGPSSVCAGQMITFADATGGGTWVSSNGNATISPAGLITGMAAGTTTITYSVANGCTANRTVTVNALGPISGVRSICMGESTTLSDTATGGTWRRMTIHTSVDSVSGVVIGSIAGIAFISYTLGSCVANYTLSVYPLSPITGSAVSCIGQTATMASASPGGVWSSTNTAVATIGSSYPVMTGMSTGTTTISYVMPTGCQTAIAVTVNPIAPISGPSAVCATQSVSLSDAIPGGVWRRSSIHISIDSASGFVTGSIAGIANILYTVGSCVANYSLTVNPLSPITGTHIACTGQTTTLATATTGGTWSSANTGIASIGSGSPVLTGVSSGTTTISYIMPTGCRTATVVTVNPLAPITGAGSLCPGQTTTLSDAISGGTWIATSVHVGIGTTSGIVTGSISGYTTIVYTTGACTATATMTVNPVPYVGSISGPGSVIIGSTMTLSDNVSGGTWTSGNTAVATVGTSGIVSGIAGGTAIISYSITNTSGCTDYAVKTIISDTVAHRGIAPEATENTAPVYTEELTLLPNPNNGRLVLSGSLSGNMDEALTITITDEASRVVYRETVSPVNGYIHQSINLEKEPKGIYLLYLRSEHIYKYYRVVVE